MNQGRWANAINRRWQFHDTALSTTVDAAFQALAIDEQRQPFQPAVWEQQPDAEDQRLEQVWFAGVHCDVGGGYPDAALADVALLWMVDRARSCGLAFRPGAYRPGTPDGRSILPGTEVAVGPDPLGPLHESRSALYRLSRPFVRPIGSVQSGREHVASTAVRRMEQDPSYAPAALQTYLSGPHHVMDVAPADRRSDPPAPGGGPSSPRPGGRDRPDEVADRAQVSAGPAQPPRDVAGRGSG
jgi:hypothetical protein